MIGRSRVIRTLDPLLPKQVRYQAALYSVRIATRDVDCGTFRGTQSVAMGRVIAALAYAFKRFAQRFRRCFRYVAKRC